jgi:hypothetical protein
MNENDMYVTLNQAKNVIGLVFQEAGIPESRLQKAHELLCLYAQKNVPRASSRGVFNSIVCTEETRPRRVFRYDQACARANLT